jgi:hypothetical protein
MADFIKDIHYYMEDTKVVFTEQWLIRKDECCGNGCRHCPFDPKHKRGNEVVAKEFLNLKEEYGKPR